MSREAFQCRRHGHGLVISDSDSGTLLLLVFVQFDACQCRLIAGESGLPYEGGRGARGRRSLKDGVHGGGQGRAN